MKKKKDLSVIVLKKFIGLIIKGMNVFQIVAINILILTPMNAWTIVGVAFIGTKKQKCAFKIVLIIWEGDITMKLLINACHVAKILMEHGVAFIKLTTMIKCVIPHVQKDLSIII